MRTETRTVVRLALLALFVASSAGRPCTVSSQGTGPTEAMFNLLENGDFETGDLTGWNLGGGTTNELPYVSGEADIISGSVPLTVNFTASGDDPDGAIKTYFWDFGGGDRYDQPTATHTYVARGVYQAKITVIDDDGGMASDTIEITVTDDYSPNLQITNPQEEEFTINNSSLNISGTVSGSNLEDIYWETDREEYGHLSPSSPWSFNLPLKTGKNRLFVQATDANGRVGTDRVIINYLNSSLRPRITNLSQNSNTIEQYEKFEVTFNVEDSVATNFYWPYETSTPPGVPAGVGITVEGLFTPDNWQTVISHPGFLFQDYDWTLRGSSEYDHMIAKGEPVFKVRFAPQAQGSWQYKIKATDASGTVESGRGSFEVIPPTNPNNHGFIKVSSSDPRYFEFSDGKTFVGAGGPGEGSRIQTKKTLEDYLNKVGEKGQNFLRPWMQADTIAGADWAPWYSHYRGYNGNVPHLALNRWHAFQEDDFFSLKLEQNDPCALQGWMKPDVQVKPSTNYKIKVRLKTVNIEGPADAQTNEGKYGFVVKYGSWLSQECSQYVKEKYGPIKYLIDDYIKGSHEWFVVENNFTTGSSQQTLTVLYLALENTTGGVAYIDEVSIRENLGDGRLGPEQVLKSRFNFQNYFEQQTAFKWDYVLDRYGEKGIYLKPIITSKQDPIFNSINRYGMPVGGDFYEWGKNTATRCWQEYWWRYLTARWGYSRAVHSWELCNEGDPFHGGHYQQTDDLAKFIHETDAHDHLATTSLWHSFPYNSFWGNPAYPNLDYADIHAYTLTTWLGDKDQMERDFAFYHKIHSQDVWEKNIGKPVVRGEAGIWDLRDQVENDHQGVWLHNFLWAQLYHGGMYEIYWWGHNIREDNLYHLYQEYRSFMDEIPLSSGFYQDAQAQVDNENLRAWGQKDVTHGKAHLWIQNKQHTWRNVVDGVPISPINGTVTIPDMQPGPYTVEWWDTYSGTVMKTETVDAGSALVLTLPHALSDDVAAKISWAGPNLSLSTKGVNRATAQQGDVLTYTITLINVGDSSSAVTLTDTIPSGTSYLASSAHVSPTMGVLNDVAGIHWSGALLETPVSLSFAVRVETEEPVAIVNTTLIDDSFTVLTKQATTIANGYRVYLPLILRH